VVTNVRQLTGPELDRLVEHAAALAEMRWMLPSDLFVKLDTFIADLHAEQEDRAAHPL
jgi:hypothetical protein